MPGWVFDAILCAFILLMTYVMASEGLWGAALMFFNVVFAGIIAMNFYEPVAGLIDKAGINWGMSDALSLLILFCVAVLLLRLSTENLAPGMVRFPVPVYHVGRFLFAAATSVVMFAFLLVAFETAPIHKKAFGSVDYKAAPPFGWGFDHGWLAFFQYTTGLFSTPSGASDPFGEYGNAKIFDPKGRWLLDHQEARPYGDEKVLGEEGGATGGEGAAGAPGAGGAGAVPVAPGGPTPPGAMPAGPRPPGAMPPGAMPPGAPPPAR
ncbi:MAG: hypothetical protein P4L84_06200 [Isosphaeraceae bacterium]|nr:hypothetical protein [Isosphaeraceae bacterium]